LVDTQPQDRRDFRIEISQRLSLEPLDPEVELAPPTQDAHDQLRRQPAVDFLKPANQLVLEQVHSIDAT
jgi:hypothetical protein